MLKLELLRTRVARRILLLFILGALAPVVTLAVYSFTAVSDQLRAQTEERLLQLSKNVGMSVMERLQHAEADLVTLANEASPRSAALPRLPIPADARQLRSIVRTALMGPGERPDTLIPLLAFSSAEAAHLAAGNTLLRVRADSAGGPALWLVRRLSWSDPGSPLVWGLIDPSYLWGAAADYVDLPRIGGFCILAGVARRLHCASYERDVADALVRAFRIAPGVGRGLFVWESEDGEFVGSNWDLFLRSNYQAETWNILVGEPASLAYAPLRSFALAFPPVLLFGFILVALLGSVLVRRTMEPLDKLAEGTRDLARKGLATRVEVDRDDEFGELARSFNTMADRLGVQFRQLEASRAIDRAVLSASDRGEVVHALLGGFGQVVAHDRLAVLTLERDQRNGRLQVSSEKAERVVRPTARDLAWLREPGRAGAVDLANDLPPIVRGFVTGTDPVLVLPLNIKDDLRGALIVSRTRPFDEEEIERARQIVDQAAIALDQVQLVTELEQMSWGTLRALARTIDAKSRWTAGHSERVSELALAIAREIGVSRKDISALERGGLLHDIGKIGISADLLDAERMLSGEERSVMESHVIIGARILEPVAAYADVIPIVLYHHERWDGSGYPEGLEGDEIPLVARILSVADTYDALVSIRPYRAAMPVRDGIKFIQERTGTAFDPSVVDAFLSLLQRRPKLGHRSDVVGTATGAGFA